MPSQSSRLRTRSARHAAAALVMSAIAAAVFCFAPIEAATAAPSPGAAVDLDGGPAAVLDAARTRTARARSWLDALKRAALPGHLLDPLPEGEQTLAIEDLRSQYSALQIKAATLATTLGDHHPDLVAAEQILADLRNKLLAAVKAAAIGAEHGLGDARAAESAAERQLTVLNTDVTGSIGARSPIPAKAPEPSPSRDTQAGLQGPGVSDAMTPTRGPAGQTSASTVLADADSERLMMALAAVAFGALAAAVALVALLRPRHQASTPARRPSEVVAEPMAELEGKPGVPVLATIALPAAGGASRLLATMEREPDGTVARSATVIGEMIQRAAEAAGFDDHVTVLVTPLSGSVEVEALATSIAVANAAASHRVLLMDARPHGRLRETLPIETPVALLIELGSVIRPAYELRVAETTLALLPSDPAELETVRRAMTRPGMLRRRGLASFDTVVVLGEGVDVDAEKLVQGADLVLIAAAEGTSPDDLAAASRGLKIHGDRPCGAIMVQAEEESGIELPRRVAGPVRSSWTSFAAARTTRDLARQRADRGGFRQTFDPSRDRISA